MKGIFYAYVLRTFGKKLIPNYKHALINTRDFTVFRNLIKKSGIVIKHNSYLKDFDIQDHPFRFPLVTLTFVWSVTVQCSIDRQA